MSRAFIAAARPTTARPVSPSARGAFCAEQPLPAHGAAQRLARAWVGREAELPLQARRLEVDGHPYAPVALHEGEEGGHEAGLLGAQAPPPGKHERLAPPRLVGVEAADRARRLERRVPGG